MAKWSRKKMKEIAKIRMKANYWKAVLVSCLLILFGVSGAAGANVSNNGRSTEQTETVQEEVSILEQSEVSEQNGEEKLWLEDYKRNAGIIVMTTTLIVFVLVLGIVIILLNVFVFNPLIVGSARFFYQNLEKNAEVKEICYTFDRGYKNAVKTMFFRDLYTFLWSLLFIIPGVIKQYEYTLIPFLLAENENMTKEEAFAESRRLMKGNKWRAFVLDLSLIPWILLTGFTFGIAGCFYVYPYFDSISAAFYQAVKEEDLFRIAEK